jgi:membrane protein DedA with SNARE-associated domain
VIETLLERLAQLPPAGIYLAIGLLAAVENIVPPVPADTAVALGAFLAARNDQLSIWTVYAVTLVANVSTATGMYVAARLVGRRFIESRVGRRFVRPRALAALERAYHRHHLWGIFTSRFLPGYRAVVPPFAGVVGLRASRALPPMIAATALYYALLVLLAWQLGANWEGLRYAVARLGIGLAVLAAAVTVLLAWLVWRHRHHLRGHE